jgi:hypothetical protein
LQNPNTLCNAGEGAARTVDGEHAKTSDATPSIRTTMIMRGPNPEPDPGRRSKAERRWLKQM